MNFLARRSIRKFKNEKLSKEVIEELLKPALVSPSSLNRKPYDFIVVTDEEKIKAISESRVKGTQFMVEAPLVILTVWKDEFNNKTEEDDCTIASTILHLKAHDMGLGSCWVQVKDRYDANNVSCSDNLKRILDIPADVHINNMLAVGYPNEAKGEYMDSNMDMTKIHINKW